MVSRTTELLSVPDVRWKALFDDADFVSEGCMRSEGDERVWYGTTSIILPTKNETSRLAEIAQHDIHARTRAIRAARREACSRAPAVLGRFLCELRVSADARGLRFDIDVQAPLVDSRVSVKVTR